MVKWWNAIFCFLMVKWWIAVFHVMMFKWWIALFHFFDVEMVNCSPLFFDGEMGQVGRVTEIFFRSKTFLVSNYFLNIVAVRFCLTHYFRRNFLNIMPRREPDGSIRWPSNSESEDDDGLEFIWCVGGKQPEIHEVLTFRDDVITPEVHPFAHVDVGAFIRDWA